MTGEPQFKKITFQPGDILFRENDKSFHFYIIQEGIVEVYKTGLDRSRIHLAEAGEGTSIGEFALIDRRPRSATAQAKTEVKVVEISAESYEKLLAELPDWAVSIMRGLVERLRNANDIIRRVTPGDNNISNELASAEYNPDASTITKTPIGMEDETPDLA